MQAADEERPSYTVLVIECQQRINWYQIFEGCTLPNGCRVQVEQATLQQITMTVYPRLQRPAHGRARGRGQAPPGHASGEERVRMAVLGLGRGLGRWSPLMRRCCCLCAAALHDRCATGRASRTSC